MRSTAIVLLSGGIDSAAVLFWSLKKFFSVHVVSYNYPSRPIQEIYATRKIADYTGVDYIEVELSFLQTATDIKKQNFNSFDGINLPEGYIPIRNLIFYALANYFAEIYNANYLIGGHVKTDREGFPDATPLFFHRVESLLNAIRMQKKSQIKLLMPFIQMTKSNVVKKAVKLGVPLELTWSCYYDRVTQCGKCESCVERREAFEKAGINDPLSN